MFTYLMKTKSGNWFVVDRKTAASIARGNKLRRKLGKDAVALFVL